MASSSRLAHHHNTHSATSTSSRSTDPHSSIYPSTSQSDTILVATRLSQVNLNEREERKQALDRLEILKTVKIPKIGQINENLCFCLRLGRNRILWTCFSRSRSRNIDILCVKSAFDCTCRSIVSSWFFIFFFFEFRSIKHVSTHVSFRLSTSKVKKKFSRLSNTHSSFICIGHIILINFCTCY